MRRAASSLISATLATIAAVWFVSAPPVTAYVTWTAGCTDCHSSFLDSTSIKPGNVWPASKHNVHRNQMLDSPRCGACHTVDGDDPVLNFSRGETGLPGKGCVGCHGVDPDPGNPNAWWGSGLRLHHANSGIAVCATCHTDDPAPMPEHIQPLYYGVAGVNVHRSCNDDGSENWTSDGLGLDNDGDLAYDGTDANCPLFADGFESGDTARWSSAIPLLG